MTGPRGQSERHDSAPDSTDRGVPVVSEGLADPRLLAAWKEWLRVLAIDADAAIAAAHVYRDLDPPARDAWLDALGEDSPAIAVPAVAIYAPLLAVELDAGRRARMEIAIGADVGARPDPRRARALRGIANDGARVVALVSPLYLCFVEVLWCRYFADEGFTWVRHDALITDDDAPADGSVYDGVALEVTPITPVIEELAHVVLAQRRHGRELPAPLAEFAHIFDARIADPSDE